MQSVIEFPSPGRRPQRDTAGRSAGRGQVVAMAHVDLEMVQQMVRCLRETGDDRSLDPFNRARPWERGGGPVRRVLRLKLTPGD